MVSNNKPGEANRRQFLKYTGAAASVTLAGLAGCAGEEGGGEYPTENLRYIVPFSEGGGTDTYARQVIPEMSDELGVEIAIENISGAASLRGTGELYHSDADGYTFGGFNPPSTPVSYMVNPQDWDMTELKGVGTYARTPFVIVANPKYEIEDFDDLVSRYQDGELEIFSGKERGGVDHVSALLMKNNPDYNLDFDQYVGYDGSGPAVQATISDEVPAAISTDTAAHGAAEDDRVDVITCMSSEGSSVFPDVDSTTDLGYPNIDFIGQLVRGMFTPPETDDEHIETLTSALETALQTDRVQEWSEDTGNVIVYGDPDSADRAVSDAFEQIPENVDLDAVREEAG